MNRQDVKDLKNLIHRFQGEASEGYQFKEFQLNKYDHSHPLHGLLENKHLVQPFIIASKFVECTDCSRTSRASQSDDSVEGSPLKLVQYDVPKEAVTTDDGHILHPVSSSRARYLLSLYNLAMHPTLPLDGEANQETPLPLWVLCSQDSGKFVYMGATWQTSTDKCLLHQYTVTVVGPTHSEPSKNLLKGARHRTIVKTQYQAQCDIFESGCQDLSQHQKGTLWLELHWDKHTSFLNVPCDARASAHAKVVAGDMRSGAYPLYIDITILQGFAQGLVEGVAHWMTKPEGDIPIMDRVKKLITDATLQNSSKRKEDLDEEVFVSLKNRVLVGRKDLDFTEQLWNILRYCSCYKDLVDCLQLVLNNLQNGTLQPMIHKSNKTKLACLIRSSYYGELVSQTLEGTWPLQLLVEIGMEKLKRDYTAAFMEKDLVTASHLEYYIQGGVSLREKGVRLEKMHYVLELVIMFEQYLSLSQVTLGASAREALKYYETHDVQDDHVFNIPIQAQSVAGLVGRFKPSLWQAHITGQVQNGEELTIYQFSAKPPFPHVSHNTDLSNGEVDSDRSLPYYLTTVKHTLCAL